jgi:cell division protease FtsH
MVTKYGFSEKLGPIVYGSEQGEVFLGRDINNSRNYSENVAADIDREMRNIIEDAYTKAEDILKEHMDKLHFLAKYLMKYEKIDNETFEKVMKDEIGEEIFNDDSGVTAVLKKDSPEPEPAVSPDKENE